MNMDCLKKGFFGYKKESVYQYFITIESEYSAQMKKKDEENKQEADRYLERIHRLEKELEETKKQMEL